MTGQPGDIFKEHNSKELSMAKRKRNPDNLFQRGNVWWIRYKVDGALVRKSLETTSQREAIRLRNEILGTRDAGVDIRERFGIGASSPAAGAPVATFNQVADRFLEAKRASSIRDQTYDQVAGIVDNWFRPVFGPKPITSISRHDVTAWMGRLKKAKSKSKRNHGELIKDPYRGHLYGKLKELFAWAVRNELCPSNPCDLERGLRPSQKRDERPTLTQEQAAKYLGKLEGSVHRLQLRRMVMLDLATGLRWGELCGLAWADVILDTAKPMIRVKRSYQGPPKNETSKNPIFLDPAIVKELKRWQKESAGRWLFPTRTGAPRKRMSGDDRELVKEIARTVGVADWESFTPHCFRHTFGTWEYERTGDAKYVQRVMRHKAIEITLRTYVHDRRDDAGRVAERPALAPVASRHLKVV